MSRGTVLPCAALGFLKSVPIIVVVVVVDGWAETLEIPYSVLILASNSFG